TERPKYADIRLPEEVPMWPEEGIAAGPPLDDAPPPPAASPPLRQATRPQQRMSGWVAAVRAEGVPPTSDLDAAVDSGDRDRLRDLARAFNRMAEDLRTKPDPAGRREQSAIVRLGLLVDADSARTAEAATYVTDADQASRMTAVARRLALVATDLWAPELGPRRSGFDPALLTQGGP